jgi:hypothetical protein
VGEFFTSSHDLKVVAINCDNNLPYTYVTIRYIVTQFQWGEEQLPLPLTGTLSLSPSKFECFWYLVKRMVNGFILDGFTVNGFNELGGYVGCKF